MTIKAYLPLFPGFYGTHLEPDETHEIEHVNEKREEKGLPPAKWIDFEWNYKEYFEEVAKNSVHYIEAKCEEIGLDAKFIYEGIDSPREYNFRNDKVKVEILVNWWQLRKMFFEVDCDDYLERFKSCSGFLSFYPELANKENWKRVKKPHNIHIEAMLEAVLLNHDDSDYSCDELCEESTLDVELYCTNYEKLTNS